MKAYSSVISARFRLLLQYRAAAIAGAGTQLFWGLIRVMIFEGFYRSTTALQPMSFPQVVTYVWLGQMMFVMTMVTPDGDVRAMVRDGTVAYEMLRPVDLYGFWYCRALAARCAPLLLRCLPIAAVALLFFGMQLPPSWGCAGAWIATTAAALLLSAALSMLATVSLLWTISGDGIARFLPALTYVLSGLLVPLPFCPPWVQSFLLALPFRGVVDIPFRAYLGQIPPERVGWMLAHQLGWTAALVLLGRWALARSQRRLVVQGG